MINISKYEKLPIIKKLLVLFVFLNTSFVWFIALPAIIISPLLAIIFYTIGINEWWIFLCLPIYLIFHIILSLKIEFIAIGGGS